MFNIDINYKIESIRDNMEKGWWKSGEDVEPSDSEGQNYICQEGKGRIFEHNRRLEPPSIKLLHENDEPSLEKITK